MFIKWGEEAAQYAFISCSSFIFRVARFLEYDLWSSKALHNLLLLDCIFFITILLTTTNERESQIITSSQARFTQTSSYENNGYVYMYANA